MSSRDIRTTVSRVIVVALVGLALGSTPAWASTVWPSRSEFATHGSDGRRIVRDSGGVLHAVFVAMSPVTATATVYYARSSDDGETWSVPVQVNSGSAGTFGGNPSIAVDSADSIHIVWQGGYNGFVDINYRTRSSGGVWGPIEALSTDNQSLGPSVAVDASDTVHVAWSSDPVMSGPSTDYIFHKEKLSGGSWPSASQNDTVSASSTGWYADAALDVDSNKTVHVAWTRMDQATGDLQVMYRSGTSGGWGAADDTVSADSTGLNDEPSIVVTEDDDVYVAWANHEFGIECRRRDSGGTWDGSVTMPGSTMDNSRDPVIGVDEHGVLHCIWQDATPPRTDIYHAELDPAGPGTDWSEPTGLSNTPTVKSEQPAMPAHLIGHMDAMWREGNAWPWAVVYSSFAERIAFARGRDVWTMNPDGSFPRQLTHNVTSDARDPSWAPGGLMLSYSLGVESDTSNPHEIWTMEGDGDEPTQVTNLPVDEGNAHGAGISTWNRDGTRLAYDFRTIASASMWWVTPLLHEIAPDGTGDVVITTAGLPSPLSEPAWSPTGSRIAGTSEGGDDENNIYTIKPNGTARIKITSTTPHHKRWLSPAWSPSGSHLTVSRMGEGLPAWARGIWRMTSTGGSKTQLSHPTGSVFDVRSSWSANGAGIAFERTNTALDTHQVFVMSPNGASKHMIASDAMTPSWSKRRLPLVGLRLSRSRIVLGRRVRLSGSVSPANHDYQAVYVQQRTKHGWKSLQRVILNGASAYAWWFKPTKVIGKRYLRTLFYGDGDHGSKSSSVKVLTITH